VNKGTGLYKKLADLNYFKNFTLDPFTIDWNNEIGFVPEYLYELGGASIIIIFLEVIYFSMF